MNKTETPQQLRLAAELIETGHPWHLYRAGRLYDTNPHMSAAYYAANRNSPEGPFEIRPILATPPDGRPLHNPDGLSAEQVGIGYRLTLTDDRKLTPWMQRWSKSRQMWDVVAFVIDEDMSALESTYRLPLTAPWPEAKPDPYAELKAAHAAGKAIEVQMPNGECFDYKPGDPQWNLQPECYRIKPEPATKQVELGPEDVPPFSLLRVKGMADPWNWILVEAVDPCFGIRVISKEAGTSHEWVGWGCLDDREINRSIPLTGRWNPTSWEPCHKTISTR